MVHRIILLATTFALGSMFAGCGPVPDPRALIAGDLQSPRYLQAAAVSAKQIEIAFHEPVLGHTEDFSLLPDLGISSTRFNESIVTAVLDQTMAPGTEYALSGSVQDVAGNTLSFTTRIYGFNPRVPLLMLNEFTTQGSGNHPDSVEIIVLEAGNLAGVTLFEGTPSDWESMVVLPDRDVEVGEFVVVHFRPDGSPEEVDEIGDKTESGGKDATDTAWDYWVAGGDGLGGNNGALTLCSHPKGEVIDAVLYSNRTSKSDDRYRGFGSSRMRSWAEELVDRAGWMPTDEIVRPEDAIDPDPSTATRSICRRAGTDTDTNADWYVVPTRGVSFGSANSTDIYRE